MANPIDSNRISAFAQTLGSKAESSEAALLSAFQLDDKDKDGIVALGKQLGLTEAEAKKHTAKSLQILAQEKHSEAQSLLGLLSEILKAGQQIRDRIISNIGG